MTKKQNKRQYKVEVLSSTYINDVYRPKGTILKVSKEFHDRVIHEKDGQLRAFIK